MAPTPVIGEKACIRGPTGPMPRLCGPIRPGPRMGGIGPLLDRSCSISVPRKLSTVLSGSAETTV